MPITPFHMGPGIAIKAVLQGSFSLMVFGWSQIVMDVQPLVVMLTGEGHLHGFSHTYIGASLLAVFSALSGKYLSEFGLRVLRISRKTSHIDIPWWVVFFSAFVGTFSHVLLDSIMHADVQPFYPFSSSNDMLRLLDIASLHKFCVYTGLFGSVLYFGIMFYTKRHQAYNTET